MKCSGRQHFPLIETLMKTSLLTVPLLLLSLPAFAQGPDMMTVWLRQKALAALDRRDAAFEKLTAEDLTTWQQDRRRFFLKQLGGFPERTPLNPQITGKMRGDDYRIEKLYFESQPGLHVTATLYLPLGKGPFPAVLHPTGHSAAAKNRALYQEASIVIVKGGCAVLCSDPIGQGERRQLFKPDGKTYATTEEHTLINQGAHLLGSNVARFMIWDGMRAIDYLQSRPDILPDKIGCTGISGGGTNTSYLMALDPRVTAAAPGCYLTGFRSLLNTIGPQDAEQNIHGQLAFGMDHADYVLMRLPKPTLIMAATQDYFDIHGAWRLYRQGKRFAVRQGAFERVDLLEADTKHGFPTEMRVGAANWMRRWLLDQHTPITEDAPLKTLPEEKLNATPSGRVLDLPDARTAYDLNIEWNKSFAAARRENARPENRQRLLNKVRELIVARKLKDLPAPKLSRVDGEQNMYRIEPEPGIQLTARWYPAENASPDAPVTLLFYGGGKRTLDEEIARIRQREKTAVLAVDLRGLGATQKPAGERGLSYWFGGDWKETTTASLLGITYVGMRAEDIWQTVLGWRAAKGRANPRPNVVATGEAAIPALHAAALQPELFGKVRLSDSIESWTALLEAKLVKQQQSNLVFGALRHYDLPMLREVLGEQLIVE